MASALYGTGVVLTEEKTKEIIHRTKEFASLNGILMRTAKTPDYSEEINYAPFALFPSLVPKRLFEQAVAIQKDFNILMHKVAHDHEFLRKSLENVIKVDSFTRELWDIYTTVRNEGFSQKICLGLFRNDLMMDTKAGTLSNEEGEDRGISSKVQLKQIEFNTIASSFGGLVGRLTNVHRYSLNLAGVKPSLEQLPDNDPAMGLSKGLIHAWELYGKESASILFLVGYKERNRFDQIWIEEKIFQNNPKISVIYRTLSEIHERSQLQTDKTLIVDGHEVAVIYMRAGYSPEHYPTKKEWHARLMIERSKAIKSPTVHYQLAGTKKIQQELARPGAVEKYISDNTAVNKIRSTFVGQHSLDLDGEGDKAVLLGINRPHDFVLKPQREGGGNNIYGEDIKDFLVKHQNSEERLGYILMERIYPWPQKNRLLKVGEDIRLCDIVNEIGIYGVYIGDSDTEYENKQVGHLMRSKTLGVDEGGIAAGFATLDTPLLVE